MIHFRFVTLLVAALALSVVCVQAAPQRAAIPSQALLSPAEGQPSAVGDGGSVTRFLESAILWGGEDLASAAGGQAPVVNGGASYAPDGPDISGTALPQSPLTARRDHVAAQSGPRMIIAGGTNAAGAALRDGASYNADTKKWQTIKDAPVALGQQDAVMMKNLMVVGPRRQTGDTGASSGAAANPRQFLTYDVTNDVWTNHVVNHPVAAWTITAGHLATLSLAGPNAAVTFTPVTRGVWSAAVSVSLPMPSEDVQRVGIATVGEQTLVTVSSETTSHIHMVTTTGSVSRSQTLPVDDFQAPWLPRQQRHSTEHTLPGTWLTFHDDTIYGLDTQTLTPTSQWPLKSCRKQASWVFLHDYSFARVGGIPCSDKDSLATNVFRVDLY